MRRNLQKILIKYFPSPYERFATGGALLVLTLPGLGMIFIRHDAIYLNAYGDLRTLAMLLECASFLLGAALIFWGVRDAAPAGTLAFRLTHFRRRRRRR